jgi:hypothetical protein
VTQFLACYDYGAGGVWVYVEAKTADEVRQRYPALTVFETPPAWWTPELEQQIRATIGDPFWNDWLSKLPDQ